MNANDIAPSLAKLLQGFFCEHLIAQRNVSHQTVASYRDAFRLLLGYVATQTGKTPATLKFEHFNAPTIVGFLEHLEVDRANSVRKRNARLAAIRSFMRYASYQAPDRLPMIQRVLAIPTKRFDKPLLGFLSREEVQAVLDAPDRATWSGHRDAVMFAPLYNTGARVSELIGLRLLDLAVGRSPSIHFTGKGRKERAVPLWRDTARQLERWAERLGRSKCAPLFPNRHGAAISRSGVESRLRRAVQSAAERCPSLTGRRVSPHTFRHTTAMHLLQAGVDITVIALWLGHESPTTTHGYLEADLTMKRAALAKVAEPTFVAEHYTPEPDLLRFLERL